jgi:hypothetical protein
MISALKGVSSMLNGFESSAALEILVAAQCCGILTAVLARLSEGSFIAAAFQWVFFVALALVGAATAVAITIGPGIWVACATSFAVMVLLATCDLNVDRRTTRFCDHGNAQGH